MIIRDESYERLRHMVMLNLRDQINEYDEILKTIGPEAVDALESLEMCMEFNERLISELDNAVNPDIRRQVTGECNGIQI